MTDADLAAVLQTLRQLRSLLLRLHKALLESEREVYEQLYGRIASTNEFFQLVLGHEWFDWLRPMSQFIVQIDEFLSAKEPGTLANVRLLLQQAGGLLAPASGGTIAEQRYYHAIQRDPQIALMHAEAATLLRPYLVEPDAETAIAPRQNDDL
jgi:hypothetical protein